MDVNDLIGGYRIRNHLHTGVATQVFEVVEPGSGRHFALKTLLPESAQDEEQRAMLFFEAEAAQSLSHDNIVKIHKIVKDKYVPYFTMEFFPAGSLRGRLQQQDMEFIREHALKIFKQLATALAYMSSQGWVHRDIKPDNILVDQVGKLKLIDFAIAIKPPTGLAKWFHRKKKPQGTPSYMSPEQIRDEVVDMRADIYSYGVTIFELLTGRTPFRGKTLEDLMNKHLYEKVDPPNAYNRDLTDEFNAYVVKMLEKDREKRQQNFHQILMDLQKLRIFKVGTGPARKLPPKS